MGAAESQEGVVVFTCTFYSNTNESRFECCLEFLRHSQKHGVRVVVVDASPDEAIREAMREAGAFQVHKQTAQGRKGAALREALALAASVASADDAWLCWQEPEKADMARHWRQVVGGAAALDVVVPMREDRLFRETYPIEQYHSESFANAYVQLAGRECGLTVEVDWHFGPFALRKAHASLWLENDGELWDAQVLPIVAAFKRGLRLGSVTVPFEAPLAMKREEEANFAYVEKRLNQINFLDPKVVAAFRAPSAR